MKPTRRYYPALTGLRVVAASMIFFHHYWKALKSSDVLLNNYLRESHVGVVIFFVLSGFLITTQYGKTFKYSQSSLFHFWGGRIKRIFPLYLLTTIPLLIINKLSPHEWFLNLTLLKGLFAYSKFSGNSPTWAITVELTFYFVAPFLIFSWEKTRLWQKMIMSMFIGIASTIIANQSFSIFLSDLFFVNYSILGRSFEFILGMWLGIKLLSHTTTSAKPWKTIGGLVSAGILMSILVALQKYTPAHLGIYHPLGFLINNYLFAGAITLLIWGLVTEKTFFSSLLSSKWMQLLGSGSYAFFLIHYTKYTSYIARFADYNFWVIFILIWIISVAIHKWIEAPIAALLTKKTTFNGEPLREDKKQSTIRD